MAEPEASQSGCGWCIRIVVIVVLLLLVAVIYVDAVASKPKIDLVFASVPPLNVRLSSANDSSITFYLLLSNSNKYAGVDYGNISVSLYDSPNRSHSIGNYSFRGFYQGFKKQASRGGRVEEDAISRVNRSVNGSAAIRIDVSTRVRLKGAIFSTKRRKVAVGANVAINEEGVMNMSKPIRLKSGGTKGMLASEPVAIGATLLLCDLLILLWV